MLKYIDKFGFKCNWIGTLPTSYNESLTYEEQLLYFLYKMDNEIIPNLNELITDFNNIDVNFDEINKKIETLQNSFTELQAQMVVFENRIYQNVDNKIQTNYNQVVQLMNDYQTLFNNSLQNTRTDLEEEIKNIELGNVIAYDPTTGTTENISTVIQNVYDALRNNSITCSEFESLELTATDYDNKEISAYNFYVNGKTFLNV